MKAVNYKIRNIYLLLGFLAMCLLSWKLSLSKTWDLLSENRTMKAQMERYNNTPTTLVQLKKELAQMNEKISKFNSNVSNQQELLEYISHYAKEENVKLIEESKTTWQKNSGFDIETNAFKIEGDYRKIVQLIYNLEYKERLCKVAGTEFKKAMDLKTKQEYLVTTLYLQNIKKEKL